MWNVYSDFIIEFGGWVAAGAALAVGIALLSWQLRGSRRRRRSLHDRKSLKEEDWFSAYFPECIDRELVRGILQQLSREIGVQWTQLRPDDEFEHQLRIRERYLPYDDFEETERFLVSLMNRHSVPEEKWPPMSGKLDAFLECVTTLCVDQSKIGMAAKVHD